MRSASPWLAGALIVLAGCGGSQKKAATDAGPEGGSAGSAGQVSAVGAGAGGAAGVSVDAAAGAGTDAAGGARPDAATEELADGSAADTSGDVGVEAPPPAPGSPLRALSVSTGTLHTCALLDNHRIKCWGSNDLGALGLGDTLNRGATAADMGDKLPFVDLGAGRTALAVSAGRYHTCAILDDGSVTCWGYGALTGLPRSLGLGNVGDVPGEMGHLPALDFGGRKARRLVSSYATSCATLDDGSTWCWGEAPSAMPTRITLDPHPETVQLAPFHLEAIALFADGTVSRTLPNGANPSPTPPQMVASVAGGETSGCFVGHDGKATCTLQGSQPWEMTTGLEAMGMTSAGATCGLFNGGAVRCWGSCGTATPSASYWCEPSQLDHSAPVALGQPAIALATAGGYHTCAVLSDGGVKCWVMASAYCPNNDGTVVFCDVPPQDAQNPNLGSAVEVVTTNGVRHYGAWREIDLGKHP